MKTEFTEAQRTLLKSKLTDRLFTTAVETALEKGCVSRSMLQRKMKLPYSSAEKLIDIMNECGLVKKSDSDSVFILTVSIAEWLTLSEKLNKERRSEESAELGEALMLALDSLSIKTDEMLHTSGPTLAMFTLKPSEGITPEELVGHRAEIAAAMGKTVEMRVTPDGESAEAYIPLPSPMTVDFQSIASGYVMNTSYEPLDFILGKDISNKDICPDLGKLPHLLIGGKSKSGKTTLLKSIIASYMSTSIPTFIRFILIDTKGVEFSYMNDSPFCIIPPINEPFDACAALAWAVNEVDRRFALFSEADVRKLADYNDKVEKAEQFFKTLPRVVIIIDELEGIMEAAPKTAEALIAQIAQKSRAAGIHLVISTQAVVPRVLSEPILSRIQSRVAFKLTSATASRLLIGEGGAEELHGAGDILFLDRLATAPKRIQGAFISENDSVGFAVEALADHGCATHDEEFIAKIGTAAQLLRESEASSDSSDEYKRAIDLFGETDTDDKNGSFEETLVRLEQEYLFEEDYEVDLGESETQEEKENAILRDPLFRRAVELAISFKRISTSRLQMKLNIDYARAESLIDYMILFGIVEVREDRAPNKVLISKELWEEFVRRFDAQ